MELAEFLEIQRGVTAVIGGGGKTSLILALGEELQSTGNSVLLCTTTKIFPFSQIPCAKTEDELIRLREDNRLLCAGTPVADSSKLTIPPVSFDRLTGWFDYVLVEADGSAQRPLKAHAPHEPVIPPEACRTICVVGLSGLGQPIEAAAHRPERYAALAGVDIRTSVTPELAARVLNREWGDAGVLFFLNQADTEAIWTQGLVLASKLNGSVVLGSLQRKWFIRVK